MADQSELDGQMNPSSGVTGFPETVWSDVRHAQAKDGVIAIVALSRMATTYWYPVYFLIRHKGKPADQAKALTEEYFLSFLESDLLASTPDDGVRFRTFLAESINRFLDPNHVMPQTGEPRFDVPIPEGPPEDWGPFEPRDSESPEDAFMKNFAKATMHNCVARLEEECKKVGKEIEFRAFSAKYLGGKRRDRKEVISEIADAEGLHAVEIEDVMEKVEQRFRRIVQDEAMTWVTTPQQGLEELQDLFSLFE